MSSKIIAYTNTYIFPILLVASIWYPLISNYSYKETSITSEITEASTKHPLVEQARIIERLELGALKVHSLSPHQILRVAKLLKDGEVNIPSLPIFKTAAPFDESLVNSSHSEWQLKYSGFIIPNILLSAYDISKDIEYLKMAKDFILGWASFEKKQWLPKGFVWNDHAISSRAIVMASFWNRYKNSPIFNHSDAEGILQLAFSTANLLQNNQLYTYKTNHGTMQNLALLKLAIYFPKLEEMELYKNKAINRLVIQFNYFINSEGAVLEHSAGYQKFGVDLLSTTIKLLKESTAEVPEKLKNLHLKSQLFLESLYREDGSLPATGDTMIGAGKQLFPGLISSQPDSINQTLLKKTGYAIWRTKSPSHLTISWAYNPNMGHKHPDELSVNLWRKSQNIITNVGYWPYKRADRTKAINWPGSNAPHLQGEAFSSDRKSYIISTGSSKNTRFIELLRKEASGFNVNRQIFQIKSNRWLILDSFEDKTPNRLMQTFWTLDSSLYITNKKGNQFQLSSDQTNQKMIMEFLSSEDNNTIHPIYGNQEQLVGWNTTKKGIRPAYAFPIEQSSNQSWSIMGLTEDAGTTPPPILMNNWVDNQNWEVSQADGSSITRKDHKMYIQVAGSIKEELTLTAIPRAKQIDTEVNQSYLQAKEFYGGPMKPLIKYRIKVSLLILFIASFVFISLKLIKNNQAKLNLFTSVSWVCLAMWVHLIYFN